MLSRLCSRRAAALATALLLVLSLTVTPAWAGWFEPPATTAPGLLLLDADTGEIFCERNADTPRPAASMTKLMSLYLIFQAIDEGRLSLDQGIPASPRAAAVSSTAGYSGHENLKEGQEYRLEDLIRLVMTASCNGSMIAMAEYLAGNEEAFVAQMNATAAAWGIQARFADSCGLKDAGNAVTPRAMAAIALRLLRDHPEILRYSTLKSTDFEGKTYNSTNTLLRNDLLEGIDGLKTGYTGGAGYCFTGTALRDGRRMLSVVMGTGSAAARMNESLALLEYGFARSIQLTRLVQADRNFTVTLTSGTDPLIPYARTTLTATFSDYDAPLSVPCEVTWMVSGQPAAPEPDRVWVENGASTTLSFRPRAMGKAEVVVRVRFPDGALSEARQSLPVSQQPLTLGLRLEPSATLIHANESLSVNAAVTSEQGYDLSFAAGWYLDGQALADGQRTDFRVAPEGKDTLVLPAGSLTPGTHTLAFRCNTGKLPQLEQESAQIVFTVRDATSAWARETVDSAIGAGLVPESLQKGFTGPITRQQAAGLFVTLLEHCSGKTISDLLKDKGLAPDPAAFSDTRDQAVLACSALGILRGTAPGQYSPNGTLTRAQAAAILNRSAQALGVSTAGCTHSFTDVAGHWADGELGWAAQNHILEGVGGGRFDPGGQLTLEQTVAIVWRAFGVLR